MSVRIHIDLDHVHPVDDRGVAHRVARLLRLPQQDESFEMLCGQQDTAEYLPRIPNGGRPSTTCWNCDLVYRRLNGIPIPENHPGNVPAPRDSGTQKRPAGARSPR